MAVIGIYSAKGGVGKTTLAVNLAGASATLYKRRTLLWDLDPQGGASYILRQQPAGRDLCSRIVDKGDLLPMVRRTDYHKLDVLPADPALQHLDSHFLDLGKRRRLAKSAGAFSPSYDRVIVDCPPGLTEASAQIMRAMDLLLVPVIPAALARRAFEQIADHLHHEGRSRVKVMPIFSMVDRRRQIHMRELETHPDWPIVPMASAFERVSEERAPISALMPRYSMPVEVTVLVWRKIERALS